MENAPPKDTTHPWAWPSKPMDRVHIDYFGPFYGKTYLILVDSYSKWCEVEVKKQIHATSTIDTCRLWFSKYGLPNQVVTDNDTQFTSNQFSEFCKRNGIKHITSAPFHQSSNGQAERFVQTIKKGLKMNNIEDGDAQLKLDNYLFHGLQNIYGLISRLLFLKIKGHLIHDVIMSSFALLWRKRQQTVRLLF